MVARAEERNEDAESFLEQTAKRLKENHGARLTREELSKILGLMNQRDYVITPVAMCYGAGFYIMKITSEIPGMIEQKRLLGFDDRRLPEDATWEEMAQVYMSPRNLELLRLIGEQRPVPEFSRYDY